MSQETVAKNPDFLRALLVIKDELQKTGDVGERIDAIQSLPVVEEDFEDPKDYLRILNVIKQVLEASEDFKNQIDIFLDYLRGQKDIYAWLAYPITEEELALAKIADWGPEEDWSDWDNTTG